MGINEGSVNIEGKESLHRVPPHFCHGYTPCNRFLQVTVTSQLKVVFTKSVAVLKMHTRHYGLFLWERHLNQRLEF